jgi:hypothetical protein
VIICDYSVEENISTYGKKNGAMQKIKLGRPSQQVLFAYRPTVGLMCGRLTFRWARR